MGKELATLNAIDETPVKLTGFANIDEMKKWASTIIDSGLLPDSISEPEQVITIVQHGKELGLTPHIALNNIHIIAGRPVISSSMLGAMLKKHKVEWTIVDDFAPVNDAGGKATGDKKTTFKFYWKSTITESVMETSFSITWNQMTLAGYTEKSNWKKYPKEMMRARCLSYAVRALFPEVLLGMYSDIEMNDVAEGMGGNSREVNITEDGDIELVVD